MKMTIVYSSDDKFARHIYISLKSLFETQIKENQLNIYLLIIIFLILIKNI